MTTSSGMDDQRKLRDIEDRKIEILMEIAEINREYDGRMSRLKDEYAELDAEHYGLRLKRIRSGRSSRGDGNHETR